MNRLLLFANGAINLFSFLQASSPSPIVEKSKSLIDFADPYVKFIGGMVALVIALIGIPKVYLEVKKLRREAAPNLQNVGSVKAGSAQRKHQRDTDDLPPFTVGRLVFIIFRSAIGLVLGIFYAMLVAIKQILFVPYIMAFSAILSFFLAIVSGFTWQVFFAGAFGITFILILFGIYVLLCFLASCYASFYGVCGSPSTSRYKNGCNEVADLVMNFLGATYGTLIGTAFLSLLYLINTGSISGISSSYWILILGGGPGLFLGVIASNGADKILKVLSSYLNDSE